MLFTIDFAYKLFYVSEKHEYEFITSITIKFDESFQS